MFIPLQVEASLAFEQDYERFQQQIKCSLTGSHYSGIDFPIVPTRCAYCSDMNKSIDSTNSIPSLDRRASNASSSSGRKRQAVSVEEDSNIKSYTDNDNVFESPVMNRFGNGDEDGQMVSRRRRIEYMTTYQDDYHSSSPVQTIPLSSSSDAWEAYNSCSSLSNQRDRGGMSNELDIDDGFIPVDGRPIYGDERDARSPEWFQSTSVDSMDHTGTLGAPVVAESSSRDAISYRSYSARGERSISASDLDNLPIMRHASTLRKQISRSISTDEWDGMIVRRSDSLLRRSSVFVHNTS